MANITQITAKSVLNKQKEVDAWFISRAHLNIYRGCVHNCAYCDGRYEGYYAPERFATDITAKQNAPELLDRALNPHRKKRPLNSGYITLGGGVSDSYQEAERTLRLSRRCLQVVLQWRCAVHVLTKSTLVLRDMALLQEIHQARGALVSFSFSTVDDAVAKVFEPGCSPPSVRLEAMARLKEVGIPVGVFFMPVIPGVTDRADAIEQTVRAVAAAGAKYVIFGGLTLKEGRQKSHYMRVLNRFDATLQQGYDKIYQPNRWGAPVAAYAKRIEERFNRAAKQVDIYRRIPPHVYWAVCCERDALWVVLNQLAYLQRASDGNLPFAKLAASLRLPVQAQLALDESDDGLALGDTEATLLTEISENQGEGYFDKFR